LGSYFVKSPKLQYINWDFEWHDENLQKNYKLISQIDNLSQKYKDFMSEFQIVLNSLTTMHSPEVYVLLSEGAQLLSFLTTTIVEQSAWKFATPTNSSINAQCPEDAAFYEMAVRYNYTNEERYCLIEVITMVKTLANLLLDRVTPEMIKKIYHFIHQNIQNFRKTTLRDMGAVASKKKRTILAVLRHLFLLVNDSPGEDLLDAKNSSKFIAENSVISASFANTQFHYIRALLEYCISDKSKGMQGGFLKEKDFSNNHVTDVFYFLENSFFFPKMMNYFGLIQEVSDLSDLWYKEFYLELTKQIQVFNYSHISFPFQCLFPGF